MIELSQFYDLYIFTSDPKQKATQILNYIDPQCKIFKGLLSREQCFLSEKGKLIKDLRIIIDHHIISIASQIDNGIPLLFWNGNPIDCELKYLTKYLQNISGIIDIRYENKKNLNLSGLLNDCLNN